MHSYMHACRQARKHTHTHACTKHTSIEIEKCICAKSFFFNKKCTRESSQFNHGRIFYAGKMLQPIFHLISFHFMPERCAASPLGGAGESDTTTESWNICIFIVIVGKNKSLRNHRSCQSIHRSSPDPPNFQVVCSSKNLGFSIPIHCAAFLLLHCPLVSNVEPF